MKSISRRKFVAGTLATAAFASTVRAALQDTQPSEATPSNVQQRETPLPEAQLREIAKRELDRLGARVWLKDMVGLADFSLPSTVPRFFLVDMNGGPMRSFLVTHGKGSDPDHTGMLQNFSNVEGSGATSRGAYLTRTWYNGDHADSMRLSGLDPDNSNAEARAIVIHGAPYANPSMIEKWGKLGRSNGCFVFPENELMQILARLSPGRLLFADRL